MALLFTATAYSYCFLLKQFKTTTFIRNKPSISFSGCGFRLQFYGGVSEYLLENFDTKDIDILCCSGGSHAAVILAIGQKMTDWSNKYWQQCYDYWKNRRLYIFLDSEDFQRKVWRNALPKDAYKTCSDRLHISISRLGFYGFYEERISNYNSNEELIDAIIGSEHIPGLFRHIPIVRGKYAFDGFWTNMKPKTTSDTLIVNLFGSGHIDYGNKMPITKFMSVVEPSDFNILIRQGYEIASHKHQTFLNCGFIAK
jgi:hypothetical protein